MSRFARFLLISAAIVGLLLATLFFLAYYKSQQHSRDVDILIQRYNQLRDENPNAAKHTLEIILAEDEDNVFALKQLAYWYLKRGDQVSALEYFVKAFEIDPSDPQVKYEIRNLIAHGVDNELLTDEWVVYATQQKIAQLFNQFYQLKIENPVEAQAVLQQIISLDPYSSRAYEELGYLYLQQNRKPDAISAFEKSYALHPNPVIAAQLGYLFFEEKNWAKAKYYFEYSKFTSDEVLKKQGSLALFQLNLLLQRQFTLDQHKLFAASQPIAPIVPLIDQLLNRFYQLKKTNVGQAWHVLQEILTRYPANLLALKEAGHMSLQQGDYYHAFLYFDRAYQLTGDPAMALQVGYILDQVGQDRRAFYYFKKAASIATNLEQKLEAEQAMVNLAGLQTKFIAQPHFWDVYLSPFYFERFELLVIPLISRLGVTLNPDYYTELYLNLRAIRDNRSQGFGDFGLLPQIFEDNYLLMGTGFRTRFFKDTPFFSFVEIGRAYDLIYRDRNRWRSDLRAGLLMYNAWGAKSRYTTNWTFSGRLLGDIYGEMIYYTRYNNNVITFLRGRQGFRLFEYLNLDIDAYFITRLFLDTKHQFFNNLYDWGPGLAIVPDNRLNMSLRIEFLWGRYIKVNSPTPNPFNRNYTNIIILLETYFRF
ncbi:MAG: tetratricopeptide repeat protein [Legionellales bacterium]|nr:tetratricopeptide repeat protein [Legionellales bacterium]